MHRFLTRSEAGSGSLVRFLKKPPFSFDEGSVASGDGATMDVSNRSALTDCTDIVLEKKASILENYSVQTSFIDGAFCDLLGNFEGKCKVSFIDEKNGQII